MENEVFHPSGVPVFVVGDGQGIRENIVTLFMNSIRNEEYSHIIHGSVPMIFNMASSLAPALSPHTLSARPGTLSPPAGRNSYHMES